MKRYIKSSYTRPYLYILKHGIGPGTLPKDVTVVKTKDLPNYYTAIWLDRFLTTSELKQYDIPSETDINKYLSWIGYCQKGDDVVPCDDIEACGTITSSVEELDLPTFREFATAEWEVLNDGSKRLQLKDLFVYFGTDKQWNASNPSYWYEIKVGGKLYKESKRYSITNKERCYKAMQKAVETCLEHYVTACNKVTASESIPYVARIGYDYGDAMHGPKFSYFEELVYAKDAEEAEELIDEKYGYSNTGDPYEGCFIRPATGADIEYFEEASDSEELPFS